MDLPRGLIIKYIGLINVVLPRVKKDARYNSSLIPRPNVMVTVAIYSKSVRDLIQWYLHF